MTLQQILLALRARIRLILLVFVTLLTLTIVISLVRPKEYTASTAVVVDVKSPDPIVGQVLPGLTSPGYMATQVDIINSERVAREVVDRLKLSSDEKSKRKWIEDTDGRGDFTTWLSERLRRGLDVRPSRESNVINIAFSASDPQSATRIANAFARAYIDVSLGLKVEPARQNARWFEEQTRAMRQRLDTAQQALASYQRESGILVTKEGLDFETAKLNELATQLMQAQAQASDSSSRAKSGSAGALTEVIQNPLITSLKTDISRLEARLRESNVNLGKNHPQTQRTESELASLKARLATETAQIVSSVDATSRIGKQKEKELSEALDRQKNRVLGLSRQRADIALLQRDVDSAQRSFEEVSQRLSQVRLESDSVQTNAVVLNAATEPLLPSKPKLMLNLLLGALFGLFGGSALALLLEARHRRIRSTEDLSDAIGLPVLGRIGNGTAPGSRPAQRFLPRPQLPGLALRRANRWLPEGGSS